jgi:outer membrane lipoprotein-sorting protein
MRRLLILPLLAAGLALAPQNSALDRFAQSWAAIPAYHATLVMHETAGSDVQDRTYDFTFSKPHHATIAIAAGPGRGGREEWNGGSTVVASPPGILSHMHIKVALTDPRVVTLRGDTVAMASFGWVLTHLQTDGAVTQKPGPTIEGNATNELTLAIADPAKSGGYTRDIVDCSTATGLPVRVQRYIGGDLVKTIAYSNIAPNAP